MSKKELELLSIKKQAQANATADGNATVSDLDVIKEQMARLIEKWS